MVPDISHLVAAIRPEVFCEPKVRNAVRECLTQALVKGDRLAYLKAAQLAQPREPNEIAWERLEECSPFDFPGQRSPVEEHTLILDYTEEPLEAVYFGLLNELQARDFWRVEKLVDTVNATPGSGLSADLNRRISMQQQEITKVLTQVHRQVRALVGQWQKWREQKRQLIGFDRARAAESTVREAALKQLKSRWQREDDILVSSEELAPEDKAAFEVWRSSSETQLRQRLEVDRRLLVNELNLLKLQANWIRPHLKPSQETRPAEDPALVTVFNTARFELVLLVAPLSDLEQAVQAGELPKVVLHPRYRRCWPILMVTLRFRAVPERSTRGAYGYRGRAEITFRSYALNQAELAVFRRELQRSQWGEVLGLLEQTTEGNLDALLADMDELLAEKPSAHAMAVPASEDTNPFSALFSWRDLFSSTAATSATPVSTEPLSPDNDMERVLRSFALIEARRWCRELYREEKRAWHLPVWGD